MPARRNRHRVVARAVIRLTALLAVVAAAPGAGADTSPPPAPAEPPRRILLVGDDLMVQAGPEVAARLEATGRADVTLVARAGTGLAGTVDWPGELAHLVDQVHPDLVVAHFGGADAPPFAVDEAGRPILPGTGAWLNRWGRGVLALMDALAQRGTPIAWVVPPPDGNADRAPITEMIGLGQQGLLYGYAAISDHIDPRAALSGHDGGFTAAAPGPAGTTVALRAHDGFGLAPEGAHRLAVVIADQVTAQWCLDGSQQGCVPSFGRPPDPAAAPAGRPRVLVAGDSLTFQVAPRLQALLEGSGRAWVHVSHRSTAGLLSQFYDWPARIRSEVARFQPDVVVLQFQGGYRPPYLHDDAGHEILPMTLGYYARYAEAARALTAELLATGARVYWVLGPEMYGRDAGGGLVLGPVWLDLAARFGDRVDFVDGWESIGLGPGGNPFDLSTAPARATRLPDLIHFTPTGADRFARLLVASLDGDGCLAGPGACRAAG
ncbi:MAG: hypothetical protein IPM45_12330 [Acidimicrobiales bacterium]|nr:hypothetical protein [Acidimicrobiales bacterium]